MEYEKTKRRKRKDTDFTGGNGWYGLLGVRACVRTDNFNFGRKFGGSLRLRRYLCNDYGEETVEIVSDIDRGPWIVRKHSR